MAFFEFMASPAGRAVRIVAGLALMATGVGLGGGWVALSVVGVVPLAAGATDRCLFAPLAHRPFRGSLIRAEAKQH